MIDTIEAQAKLLALENRRTEPAIRSVFWFPDPAEVRLVEVSQESPPSEDGLLHPFYFPASPDDDLPAPTGIALIRPDELGRLVLPQGWGTWSQAVEMEIGGAA
jgi:hypothetical protein